MNVLFDYRNEVLTAKLCGDIDHHCAVGIRETIDMQLQSLRPMILKLDFSRVPFMDSSGIGLILGRVRMMKHWNGQVMICNITEDISKMAKIAGVFSLVSSEE